ncbi:MAG: hypothetical protein K2I04_01775, partial [Muribaculaceae bacterium]|nr:hypothetical protein [Muribaculaceae bacterium]
AVLLAKARSKCDIIFTPDSALLNAVDHYRGSGDSLEVQSLLYLGEAFKIAEDYSHALLTLNEAYSMAEERCDHFYAGMAARFNSDIYQQTIEAPQNIRWAYASLHHFSMGGYRRHAEWAKIDIANAYLNDSKCDKALLMLDSIDDSVDCYIGLYKKREQADALCRLKDYDAGLRLYGSLENHPEVLNAIDWCKISEACYAVNDIKKAKEALETAKQKAMIQQDSLYVSSLLAPLLAFEGNHKEAYEVGYKWGVDMMTQLENRLIHPQTALLTENFRLRSEAERQKAHDNRLLYIVFGTVAALLLAVLLLVLYIGRQRLARRREQIVERFNQISRLEEELQSVKNISEDLRNEVNKLIGSRLKLSSDICEVAFFSYGSSNLRKTVNNSINDVIAELSGDRFSSQLEEQINKYNSDWMLRFREAFPDIKPVAYRLAMYLFLGFSHEAIAGLLKKNTVKAVYDERYRLKKFMLETNPEKAQEFGRRIGLMSN